MGPGGSVQWGPMSHVWGGQGWGPLYTEALIWVGEGVQELVPGLVGGSLYGKV